MCADLRAMLLITRTTVQPILRILAFYIFSFIYIVNQKRTLDFCPYLCQIPIDFQNSCTDRFTSRFE